MQSLHLGGYSKLIVFFGKAHTVLLNDSTNANTAYNGRCDFKMLYHGVYLTDYGRKKPQSLKAVIYYVDLVIREGLTLEEAVQHAKEEAKRRLEAGINQAALDEAAECGFNASPFEYDEDEIPQIVEEFYPSTNQPTPADAKQPQAEANAGYTIQGSQSLLHKLEAQGGRHEAT